METTPSLKKSTFKHSSRKRSSHLCIASVGILMMGAVPFASADDQFVSDSGNVTFSTEELYTGGNFIPPDNADYYEGTGQRDAFLVIDGATVTFAGGADIKIQNSEDKTAFIRVGNNYENGTLNIEEGATLTVGSITRYANFQIGNWGGTGVVNQSGGNVTVIGSFEVGNQGGTGTYRMTGGTLDLGVSGGIAGNYSLARSTPDGDASQGTFQLDGGNLNLNKGYMTLSSRTVGNGTQGTGIFTQTSGTFTVRDTTQLAFTGENASGEGIYNLNGGTLAVGGQSLRAEYDRAHSESTNGRYEFNLGGGTIKVIDSDLHTAVNATLVEDTTSEIDTNGFNATWSGSLTGDGHLKKTGSGELTLSGSSNTYTGTTEITAGTLLVTSRTGSGDVTIRAGATLSGTGIVAGAATIEGRLDSAALTFEKGLTLESTASTVMKITGLNAGEFDAITVTGGNFILGGELTLNITGELQFGDSLNLFDLDASVEPSSNFDLVTLAGIYGLGNFTWQDDHWLATLDGAYFTFDVASGVLNFEAIPEPGSWALLAGGAALTCWLRRRKKA